MQLTKIDAFSPLRWPEAAEISTGAGNVIVVSFKSREGTLGSDKRPGQESSLPNWHAYAKRKPSTA
ncbi:hypothetical protein T11_2456 [Trichinella zimbabwensis]|uniref:Uncharacterized protein n=1 Tax=Trichinella zimbabwensis TaxID=268475 RepID=A0A0V1HBV8_9BILA|nr:hypothetical protein T11_2456 [Trichinella zimbabwensis]